MLRKIMEVITALWQYVVENKDVVIAAAVVVILNILKDTVFKDIWGWIKKTVKKFNRFVKKQTLGFLRTVKLSFYEVNKVLENVETLEDFVFGLIWLMMLLFPFLWAAVEVVHLIMCIVKKEPWTYEITVDMASVQIALFILTMYFCKQAKKRREKEGLPTTW